MSNKHLDMPPIFWEALKEMAIRQARRNLGLPPIPYDGLSESDRRRIRGHTFSYTVENEAISTDGTTYPILAKTDKTDYYPD
jgi:hypothetical protein